MESCEKQIIWIWLNTKVAKWGRGVAVKSPSKFIPVLKLIITETTAQNKA